jgi:hypothetical protein
MQGFRSLLCERVRGGCGQSHWPLRGSRPRCRPQPWVARRSALPLDGKHILTHLRQEEAHVRHSAAARTPPTRPRSALRVRAGRQHPSTRAGGDAGRNGAGCAPTAVSRLCTNAVSTRRRDASSSIATVSIVQGPVSVAPCQTLVSRFATFSSLQRVGAA